MRPGFRSLSAAATLICTVAIGALFATDAAGQSSAQGGMNQTSSTKKIRIAVDTKVITATLADNETAKEFAALLPLTLTMSDLFGREKTAQLPRAISTAGPRSSTYAVGDVILWSPRPSVAIFYRHDGQTIPSPGSILIARADAGVEALNVTGSVRVTIERLEE